MTQRFICTLLSDVVLPKRAATEGHIDGLDYLPGAKFMGIVAHHYNQLDDRAKHELFHSGAVRYGNAYPYVDKRVYYPAPFNYFARKGETVTSEDVYLDHLLTDPVRKDLSEKGIQLKQLRSGFVDSAGESYLRVNTDFQLKSAYDAELRRSQDAQMYGYFSIPAGATFAFSVEDSTGTHGGFLQQALVGVHGIGRSRTAQYGRVRIELAADGEGAAAGATTSNPRLIYAVSDLSFEDTFGRPRRPEATDLGLSGRHIDWSHSQVRYRTYQSWNGQRWNRNADRWVVEKGSVFVLHPTEQTVQPVATRAWVGTGGDEGFGQIWLDPPFMSATLGAHKRNKLQKKEFSQHVSPATEPTPTPAGIKLQRLLTRRKGATVREADAYDWINTTIQLHGNKFAGISASQWGTLRNYAKHAGSASVLNQLIFHEDAGFLYRGQSESIWREKRELLQQLVKPTQDPDARDKLMKLASEMAKRAKKNQTV